MKSQHSLRAKKLGAPTICCETGGAKSLDHLERSTGEWSRRPIGELRRTNIFLRVVLFLFTLMIVGRRELGCFSRFFLSSRVSSP